MKSFITTLVLLTGLGLSAAHADGPGGLKEPKAGPKEVQGVTLESLGKMLTDAGYEVIPLKDNDGKVTSYNCKFKHGTWNISLVVAPSRDGSLVWMTATLRPIEGNTVPASAVVKLLQLNDSIYPAYFSAFSSGTLMLTMPVTSANLTETLLKAKISFMAEIIKETASAWDTAGTAWKVGQPAAPTGTTNPPAAPTPPPAA